MILHNIFDSCILVTRQWISNSWSRNTCNWTTSSWIIIYLAIHMLLYSLTTLIFWPTLTDSFLLLRNVPFVFNFNILWVNKFSWQHCLYIIHHFFTIISLYIMIIWFNFFSCSFFLNDSRNDFISNPSIT